MGKNLRKLFSIMALAFCANVNIAAHASDSLKEIEYKTILGIPGSPLTVTQNVKIPVRSDLSSLSDSDFNPITYHENFVYCGFAPYPESKIYRFAAPYTSISMSYFWPLNLYQYACIENMSNPDNVIFKPGRDFFHKVTSKEPMIADSFGIDKAYMAAQLMLPSDFNPDSGEKLNTIIYVTGTTGRRLSEESFALKFNGHNCAVLLIDPRELIKKDWRHDHLSRDLMGMGGAILRFQEILATAPFLTNKVSILGDSIGGLLVWLSLQKEIADKYTHPMDVRAIAIANIPPVMTFKSSYKQPPQVPLCLIHGEADEFIPHRMVSEWKAYGNLPYGIYSVPGGHHDFLANPIDLSTFKNGKLNLKPQQEIAHFPIVEMSMSPEEAFQQMHPRIMAKQNELLNYTPDQLFNFLMNELFCDVACVTPLQLKSYESDDSKISSLKNTSAKAHAELIGPQRYDDFYKRLTDPKKDKVTFAPMDNIKERKKIRDFITSNLTRVFPKPGEPEGHKVDEAFSTVRRAKN